MRGWTKSAVSVVGGGMIIWGAMTALAPPTTDSNGKTTQQVHQERGAANVQKGLDHLNDSRDIEQERIRSEGNEHVDSENRRRLLPGEYRPPENELPKIRIRLP